MENRTKLKERAMDSAIAFIFVITLVISFLIYNFPGVNSVAPSVSPFLVLIPENMTSSEISEYAGITKTYSYDLSQAAQITPGGNVFFYLRHNIVNLEIDGREVVDTGETADKWHIGHTPGGYWIKVPIRSEYNGKKMTLKLTPVYKNVADDAPELLVIDRQMLIHAIVLPKEGLVCILSSTAIIMGLLLILLSLIIGLDAYGRRKVFYLGAIAVTAGIWKLSGQSILPLIFDYYGRQKLLWYIGSMAYMLMLVLSLRLLDVLHGEENNLISRLCTIIAAASMLIILILQILGLVDLHDATIPFGICVSILHLITLFQKPGKSELLWLIPTFVTFGIDGLFLFKTGSIRDMPLLIIWIILNLIGRGFWYLKKSVLHERQLLKQEEELRYARMQTMINEIRPHFIFNTLSSISMLCDTDPQRAMEITANFNNYLQASFTAIAKKEPVPFETELAHTKAYLNVEKALYIDKLTVDYDTEYTDFCLPPLTLQPIVENSVKHGIKQTHEPEHIVIRTRKASGGAEVIVEDNGPGITTDSADSSGHVGLKNVTERLKIMCGGNISIGVRPGGGSVVTIHVNCPEGQG